MKGFTLFFAMLVGSLALAVGLAIFDLTIRELDLSAVATQSQYAIYAADTGAECALYWDAKYNSSGFISIFSAPTSVTGLGANVALCNNQDIFINGTPPAVFAPPPTGWSNWNLSSSTLPDTSLTIVTIFTLSIPNNAPSNPQTYCAVVYVTKTGNPAQTTIVSHGYNTCTAGALRLERAIQVSY